MLKVISTQDLTLGMFIHALTGDWIDHPFWKKSFLLEKPADLIKLQQSIIKEVLIDTNKGLDVFNKGNDNATNMQTKTSIATISSAHEENRLKMTKTSHTPISTETARARDILQSSKKAVSQMFKEVRMGKALNLASSMAVVDEIADSVERNKNAFISLARLKHKDDYTYMHSIAVCALMVALAKELKFSAAKAKLAGLAGLWHDIGKVKIPLDILNKSGSLTHEEFSEVKQHPEQGYQLLQTLNVTEPIILDVCLHHHEKINGTGYPNQLQDDEISLFAKMGAVCDVYDAVTSNRPYKAGWEPGVALQRMAKWEGHFDPKVFKVLVQSVGIYPIGSMVKLKSGRLAVVIDQNNHALLTPVVKVFFSSKANARISYEVLDLAKKHMQDEIVGHEDSVLWGIHDFNAIWAQES